MCSKEADDLSVPLANELEIFCMVHEVCKEGEKPMACELFCITHTDLLLPARVSIAASEKGNEKYVNLNLYSCSCVVGEVIFVLS